MNSELGIAMHALVFLSRKKIMVSSEGLAKSVCTNPARIRKVMSRLKAAGLVGAKEGAVGGYYMIRSAESITLDMLLDALNLDLVAPRTRSSAVDVPCVIASGMEDVIFDLCKQLNDTCRAQMMRYSIADVDERVRLNGRICPDEAEQGERALSIS